jgi:hypothetical protein
MVVALGRFVTEVGEVENVMFETILAVAQEDANEVHRRFYQETFGPKVKMLEERIKHDAFDEHREGVDYLVSMLRKLASQRNNIIHGETFHLTRRGESKVFRVGFTQKNLTPWKDFDFKGNAENIFTADQIEDVTAAGNDVRGPRCSHSAEGPVFQHSTVDQFDFASLRQRPCGRCER